MSGYNEVFKEEALYLSNVMSVLRKEIERASAETLNLRSNVIASRKEMWENSAHYSTDFTQMTEVNQHLAEVSIRTKGLVNSLSSLKKYEAAVPSPYFGRFDFIEDSYGDEEKYYIGRCSIIDSETFNFLVYDWRSPAASMYYNFTPGPAFYKAPAATIKGKLTLKRQYIIENSDLKNFLDCSTAVRDEILLQALSGNTSPVMKSIVETIQKEQDEIIRNTDDNILLIQGTAGSGKTSAALHRIAYLLYNGFASNLRSNNILILSPCDIFTSYISQVLPELGEEITKDTTYKKLLKQYSPSAFSNSSEKAAVSSFKGSVSFIKILDRFLQDFEKRRLPIEDIYYCGKTILTKEEIYSRISQGRGIIPLSKRLQRVEQYLSPILMSLGKSRLKRIEDAVQERGLHELELKPFARLLSIKLHKKTFSSIQKFTQIDITKLYKELFSDKNYFLKLSKGISLPENIDCLFEEIHDEIVNNIIDYEDACAIFYMKVKLEGIHPDSSISHVFIDEAQDYSLLQYKTLSLLYKDSSFTILGDIYQAIYKTVAASFYSDIADIFIDKKVRLYELSKSYRSSYEIFNFAHAILGKETGSLPYERHEEPPRIISIGENTEVSYEMLRSIDNMKKDGMKSIAILCRNESNACSVHSSVSNSTSFKLILSDDSILEGGLYVMPVSLSKGLEFDGVILYDVSNINYSSGIERNLLYVACTRALHRLHIMYKGEPSPFLP